MNFTFILGRVRNYPEMLKKIFWWDFIVVSAALWFLEQNTPFLNDTLSRLTVSLKTPAFVIDFPGFVIPAIILAIVSKVWKFHDRLSDVLGIRQRFDLFHVLMPLAKNSRYDLTEAQVRWIMGSKRLRKLLMSVVFYKYASSGEGAAVIDRHYIEQALDQWSWYWVFLDAAFVSMITMLVSIFFIPFFYFLIPLAALVLCCLMLVTVKRLCVTYAESEVDQILNDEKRKSEIKEAFQHALQIE